MNMKSFSDETLTFFLQKNLFLLHFGSYQNCMNEFLRQDSQSSYSFGKIYVFSGCKCLTEKKNNSTHNISQGLDRVAFGRNAGE